MHPLALKALFESYRFTVAHEAELKEAVCQILVKQGIEFQLEVWLNKKDRVDLMVGSVGIELKVRSVRPALIEQIWRYLKDPRIQSLLLVTTQRTVSLPPVLLDKPVFLVHARGI